MKRVVKHNGKLIVSFSNRAFWSKAPRVWTEGSDIDHSARMPLKKIGLDYPHGTGHGVGYFLNVHEGPQSLSKKNNVSLKHGMIISNEPGYYKEGYFGIRIENLVFIKKNKFEELTMAPIEKNLISKNMLNKKRNKLVK